MTIKTQNELKRRVFKKVRNIVVSPLFEVGKTYNIDRHSAYYEKEDAKGTMSPDWNHCWLTWESFWQNPDPERQEDNHWSNQAYNFGSVAEAEEGKAYLEKHLS